MGHSPFSKPGGHIPIGGGFGKLPNIGNPIQGHAVLGGPAGCLPALRPEFFCRIGEGAVFPPGSVVPRAVVAAAQEEIFPCVAHGPASLFIDAIIDAIQLLGTFQGDHITALLVHPGKVHPRQVEERVMGGKDNLLRSDPPSWSDQGIPLHREDRCFLIHRQLRQNPLEKFQGMELGLIFKPDCPRHRKRKGGIHGEGCIKA